MQELESVHASDARANAGTHEAQTRQPRSTPGWSRLPLDRRLSAPPPTKLGRALT